MNHNHLTIMTRTQGRMTSSKLLRIYQRVRQGRKPYTPRRLSILNDYT